MARLMQYNAMVLSQNNLRLQDHERAISLAESAAHCHPHPEVRDTFDICEFHILEASVAENFASREVMHFLGEEYARVGEQHKAGIGQCSLFKKTAKQREVQHRITPLSFCALLTVLNSPSAGKKEHKCLSFCEIIVNLFLRLPSASRADWSWSRTTYLP